MKPIKRICRLKNPFPSDNDPHTPPPSNPSPNFPSLPKMGLSLPKNGKRKLFKPLGGLDFDAKKKDKLLRI